MNERDVREFVEDVKRGKLSTQEAVERLRQLPYEDLGFAKIDHHRPGFPVATPSATAVYTPTASSQPISCFRGWQRTQKLARAQHSGLGWKELLGV